MTDTPAAQTATLLPGEVEAETDFDPAPAAAPKRGIPHIPALDGLRGVAVLGVLLFHGGYLKGGYLGVDLFFVLSGYLITMLLLTEWRSSGKIRLGNFWIRRIRRLFPALIAVLLAVAVYARFVADPTALGRIRSDGLATLFYIANWHDIFAGHVYGELNASPSPLLHTWSLAIEEQFYLIWPLVVLALLKWRNRPQTILKLSLGVVFGSFGLMVILNAAGIAADPGLYEGTHTRVAAIGMGAALSSWQLCKRKRSSHAPDRRGLLEVGAVVSLCFLAAMWTLTDVTTVFLYWGGLALCGVAVTVILASISHPEPGPVSRIFSFTPFCKIGLISYGLYLWHWPIFLYLNEARTGISGFPLFALQIFVAFDVAILSYFAIEMPIRRGALTGKAARSVVLGSVAVVVIALLASTTGAVSPGGGFAGKKTDTRLVGAGAGVPKVMVVGDSVAYGLATEGMAPVHKQLGIAVSNNAYIGCNLLLAIGTTRNPQGAVAGPPNTVDCTDKWPTQVKAIKPNVVIMVFGAYPAFSVEIGGKRYTTCDAPYRTAFQKRLTDVAKVLTASGAKLEITTLATTDNGFVRQQVPDVDKRTTCMNDDIKAVAAAHPTTIGVLDLQTYLCPHGACQTTVSGHKLREDGLHYKGVAAEYVSRWLVARALANARSR